MKEIPKRTMLRGLRFARKLERIVSRFSYQIYIRTCIAYSVVVTSRHFVSSVKTGEKLGIYQRNEQFPRHIRIVDIR